MKHVIILITLFVSPFLFASSVEWNCFTSVNISGYQTVGYVGNSAYTDTSISLLISASGGKAFVSESGYTSLVSFSSWTVAYAGEIIAASMFEDESRRYLYRTDASSGDVIELNASHDSLYLAIETQTWKDEYFYVKDKIAYAWVELEISEGEISVVDSAFNFDGGAMYVGGGAVPEPMGGMLLLLGFATMMLKRKKNTSAR